MTGVPPLLSADVALFLDFDGTLAPLQDDPKTVHLPPGGEALLLTLASQLSGALAIVTGRDIRDIAGRVPAALWRSGNHGLVIAEPGGPLPGLPEPPPDLEARARALANRHGLVMEIKGPVLTLHHRLRPEVADEVGAALEEFDLSADGYRIVKGNGVHELKPEAASKARAVETLMDCAPFSGRVPIFVGDDTTDEDGINAAMARGGYGVRVAGGETAADYRLGDPASVWDWIERSSYDLS